MSTLGDKSCFDLYLTKIVSLTVIEAYIESALRYCYVYAGFEEYGKSRTITQEQPPVAIKRTLEDVVDPQVLRGL